MALSNAALKFAENNPIEYNNLMELIKSVVDLNRTQEGEVVNSHSNLDIPCKMVSCNGDIDTCGRDEGGQEVQMEATMDDSVK